MGALRRGLLASAILLASCGPRTPEHEVVEPAGPFVRIARAAVADGAVHFFTFRHEGDRVNFLVRTDAAGELRAHLDACYGCYRYKMGYVVDEEELVCRACRLRYPIAEAAWDLIGACAPIPLRVSLDGDDLVIERAVLERAARYF